MGVYDYCDFVQKNGQCLTPLQLLLNENDESLFFDGESTEITTSGSQEAIIVLIPFNEKIENFQVKAENIKKWSLDLFKDYPIHFTDGYRWDGWSFNDIENYDEFINSDDASIWISKTFPDKILVNFEVNTYKVFVSREISYNLVPWSYYFDVLGDKIKIGISKKEIFELIITNKFRSE
jgi:hypothetical protein